MSQVGFYDATLPSAVTNYLRDTNPWWVGKPGRVLPRYRRWLFALALKNLNQGLAPVLALRGPRQARRILRVQFDDLPSLRGVPEPILAIARWSQAAVLGETFNEAAHRGEPAFVFLDEVQNLPAWAPQVKALVDHSTLKVLLTGSSSLRITPRSSSRGRVPAAAPVGAPRGGEPGSRAGSRPVFAE